MSVTLSGAKRKPCRDGVEAKKNYLVGCDLKPPWLFVISSISFQ